MVDSNVNNLAKLYEDVRILDEKSLYISLEIKKLENEIKNKQIELKKNKVYADIKRELIEEEKKRIEQKEMEERKQEYLANYSADIHKNYISVFARMDDLPTITTSDYRQLDLNEVKNELMTAKSAICRVYICGDGTYDFDKLGDHYIIPDEPAYVIIDKRGSRIRFSLDGGNVEFLSGTSFFDTGHDLQCCSRADDEKRKEFMQKYAEKVKNIEKKCVVAQKKEEVKANPFTKMTKGEMYRLDIDKLPEVSLVGEINVNLADYKKDLEALQNGEMLTFGRIPNEDETIETDRGEKLISFENKSRHVSRKHLSVVNFGGNLYMQDRSLNGTGMREAGKTDKDKSFIKPMEKDR